MLVEANRDIHSIVGAINIARDNGSPEAYEDAEQFIHEIIDDWHESGRIMVFISMLSSFSADLYRGFAQQKGLSYQELLQEDYARPGKGTDERTH